MGDKNEEPQQVEKPDFPHYVDVYVDRLASLYTSLMTVAPLFGAVHKSAIKEIADFIDKHRDSKTADSEGDPKNEENDEVTLKIKPADLTIWRELDRRNTRLKNALRLIPEMIVVSYVSQYDAFLGHLIRGLLLEQPDILNASQKTLAFSDLMAYPTIAAAREKIIEDEIESVLRKSHSDHFEWLESRLKIPLRKGLDIWPLFVEITERRNLFVHTGGMVSSQYLKVCKEHGVSHEHDCVAGQILYAPPKYGRRAYLTFLEIGVKLAHVMWRKLKPDDVEKADSHLNELCIKFIDEKYYDLAIKLIDFRMYLPKVATSSMQLMFKINKAQACKWKKDEASCKSVLADIDWDPLAPKFQVAKAVLEDRFDDAASLMASMGANGEISEANYRLWPLFREYRKSSEFAEAFEKVFGTTFTFTEDDSAINHLLGPLKNVQKPEIDENTT